MSPDSSGGTEYVPLRRVPDSAIPLLGATLSVLFAVGYALGLGYVLEMAALGEVLTFVLYFGGLGAGIGFVARRYSISAAIGVVALTIIPALYTWAGGWASWPQAVVSLASAGGVAFGIFLISVGFETVLRKPKSVLSLLTARDTRVGIFLGLFVALVVFGAGTPPDIAYRSVVVQAGHYLIIGSRGLFLVASVLVPVLFITRKRVISPALLVGSIFGIAAFGVGRSTVWFVTPESLAEHGIAFLALALGAGFIELSFRALFTRVQKMRGRSLG